MDLLFFYWEKKRIYFLHICFRVNNISEICIVEGRSWFLDVLRYIILCHHFFQSLISYLPFFIYIRKAFMLGF